MENPAVFQSADLPGVQGTSNTNDGGGFRSTTAFGVFAASVSAAGLRAVSETGRGIEAQVKSGIGEGVVAQSEGGAGCLGLSNTGDGVVGKTNSGIGVFAVSVNAVGLRAVSENARALEAEAKSGTGEGVVAGSQGGDGVFGISATGIGIHGKGGKLAGLFEGDVKVDGNIFGQGIKDAGVTGLHGNPQLQETTVSGAQAGVFGACDIGAGVVGYARNTASFGVVAFGGLSASALNHPFAGLFNGTVRVEGNVQVTGDVSFPGGVGDFGEQFNFAGSEVIEPGSVVVIDHEDALKKSEKAYDTKVAGVVSGAGKYRPGIVLDKQHGQGNRLVVALGGKVYCRADAGYGAIEIGDQLTSSPTQGCAMKASDPKRAFGAVIGKALRPLKAGQELIPILIALQ